MAIVFLSFCFCVTGKLVAIAVTDEKDPTEQSNRYRRPIEWLWHVMLRYLSCSLVLEELTWLLLIQVKGSDSDSGCGAQGSVQQVRDSETPALESSVALIQSLDCKQTLWDNMLLSLSRFYQRKWFPCSPLVVTVLHIFRFAIIFSSSAVIYSSQKYFLYQIKIN